MTRLRPNHLLAAAGVCSGAFLLLAWLFPTALLIEFLNGVFLVLTVLVGFVWLPGLFASFGTGARFTRELQLHAGIGCIWVSLILQRSLSAAYRYLGKPESWSDSVAWAVAIWVAIVGAILFLSASGTDKDGRLREPERLILYLGLPLAIAATIAVLSLRPLLTH